MKLPLASASVRLMRLAGIVGQRKAVRSIGDFNLLWREGGARAKIGGGSMVFAAANQERWLACKADGP